MRRMDDRKKRLIMGGIAIFLALIFVLGMIAPFLASAAEIAPVSVSVQTEAGMNGIYKVNRPMPVNIFLENNGPDFKGELYIKVNRSSEPDRREYINYVYPVELNVGGTEKISLDVTVVTIIKALEIELRDERGAVVSTHNAALEGMPEESVLIGILSDDGGALDYMKSMTFYDPFYQESMQLSSRLLHLDNERSALSEYHLSNLTALIINDYDTGRLTAAQIALLNAWVNRGGNLILGTGQNFDKVFRNIGETFIPVTKTGETRLDTLSDPDGFYDTADFAETPVSAVTFAENAVFAPVLSSGDTTAAYTYKIGAGTVLLYGFDLGLAAISENYTAKAILNNVYTARLTNSMAQNFFNRRDYSYALENIETQDGSILTAIFLLTVVYVVVIGPVLYFVLKKMDKREKGWLAIPACALMATLVIFILSRGSIYTKPIVNNMNELALINGASAVTADRSFVALTPDKGDIRISFSEKMPQELSLGGYFDSYYIRGFTPSDDVNFRRDIAEIRYGEAPGITYYDTMSWGHNYFNSTEPIQLNGGITAEIYMDGDMLKGTIVNNTGQTYDELMLCYHYFYQKYTAVQPGQTLAVNLKMDYSTPEYIDLMNNPHVFPDILMDIDPYNYRPNDFTAEQLAEERKKRMKSRLLANFMNYTAPELSPPLLSADIYAFNHTPLTPNEVFVNGQQANMYTTNIFRMQAEITADGAGAIELPYGVLKPVMIETDSPYYYDGYNTIVLEEPADEIIFAFAVPALLSVTDFDFESTPLSAALQREIYHSATGEWEALDADASGGAKQYTADYVDADGSIRVRYRSRDIGRIDFPRVRISCTQ